jgi:hypothetical protein
VTALLLHTTLSVVLVGWAYMVTSRFPYRTGWIWAGSLLVVLVGYTALLARSVFDGSPARVQTIVGNVGGVLLAVSGLVCFVLYGLVSRGPRPPVAAAGAARADVSGWAPRDEESVIAPDGAEDWDGPVIDVGTWPSGTAPDAPRGGRYAYASADESEPAPAAPARAAAPVLPDPAPRPPIPAVPVRAPSPAPLAPPASPPATAAYQPIAPPPVAPSEWPTTSSADEDEGEPVAPRRALPPADDMRE